MSDITEPILTDAQREQWQSIVADYLNQLRYILPTDRHVIQAVAIRLTWLEAEREHLVKENAEQWARLVRTAMDPSEEAMERDQARAALTDEKRAFAEIAAVHDEKQIELVATRKERDRAVAEAAVLRGLIEHEEMAWALAAYQILSDIYAKGHQERHLKIAWEQAHQALHQGSVASYAPLAAKAATVLAAARDYRDEWQAIYSVETNVRDSARYQETIAQAKARLRLVEAVDAYRAAVADRDLERARKILGSDDLATHTSAVLAAVETWILRGADIADSKGVEEILRSGRAALLGH